MKFEKVHFKYITPEMTRRHKANSLLTYPPKQSKAAGANGETGVRTSQGNVVPLLPSESSEGETKGLSWDQFVAVE